jgi:hypothetical protein
VLGGSGSSGDSGACGWTAQVSEVARAHAGEEVTLYMGLGACATWCARQERLGGDGVGRVCHGHWPRPGSGPGWASVEVEWVGPTSSAPYDRISFFFEKSFLVQRKI